MRRTLLAVGFGALFVGAGCYGYDYAATTSGYPAVRSVSVAVAPPAPIYERPAAAPYPGAVWMAGYWDWRADLGRHVWIGGHWSAPPRAGVVYVPPTWRVNPYGGYYRVPARWVAGAPRDSYGRHLAYDSLGRPYYF